MPRHPTPPSRPPPADTRWKPGQSGNPTGKSRAIHELEAQARRWSPEAIEVCARILRGLNDKNKPDERVRPADQIRAAEILLERAHGRPRQDVALSASQDLASALAQFLVPGSEDRPGEPAGDPAPLPEAQH